MRANFADRLTEQILARQSQLCLGLDPRLQNMPPGLLERCRTRETEGCGRRGAAACIEEFCVAIIDAAGRHAAAVKIQLACFEQFGAPGLRAFKHICGAAAEAGLVVIADGKRGDIDVSAAAYSAAYLGRPEGLEGPIKPMPIDALTVNPLFGSDGIDPFVRDCHEFGKGIFILVKTSNPGSSELQGQELADGSRFYEKMAKLTAAWGRDLRGASGFSSVGAVVGATDSQALARLRKALPEAILLVPGVGAQGAAADAVIPAFDQAGLGALITVSRSIIYAGSGEDYASRAAAAAGEIRQQLWAATH